MLIHHQLALEQNIKMICEIGRQVNMQTVMLNQFAKFCTLKIMFINVIDHNLVNQLSYLN